MRTLSPWALALLALTALGLPLVSSACSWQMSCFNDIGWLALLFLLGFCGFVLALIAAILGCVSTVKRRQWGWCVGLVVGVLVPLPAGLGLGGLLGLVYGQNALLPYLLISVGLVLTPVVTLIYSTRYPSGAAAERSSSPVPLPALQTLEEPVPPPLDAP